MASCMDMEGHPSTLPGDPSLNLVTNIDLGDKKLDFMKGLSIEKFNLPLLVQMLTLSNI